MLAKLPLPTALAVYLCCALSACTETEAATQVLVAVSSDLLVEEELDTLEVRVLARDEIVAENEDAPHRTFSLTRTPRQNRHTLPLSFTVAPKRNDSREDFRVIVTGLAGGEVVVEQQAIASFVPEKALVLELFLSSSCLKQLCRDRGGQRTANACDYLSATCSEVKPSEDLPEWGGPGSELEGGVPGGAMDGGSRADADAARDEPDDGAPGPQNDGGPSGPNGDAEAGSAAEAGPDGGDSGTEGGAPGACGAGFTPADGGCADIVECSASASPCDGDPIASCTNTVGSFSCSCPSGFSGDGVGSAGCVPQLTALSLSAGTLTPSFNPAVMQYSADSGPWESQVVVTASAPSAASLTIGGSAATSGQGATRNLNVGANELPVVVSAGGATRSYALTVTRSAPARAYLKASNTGASDQFAEAVAISADGSTIAVGAKDEDSATSGSNSTPNEGASSAGAVYVFRRNGASWTQEAYLKSTPSGAQRLFGASLGLSADGATLAVGAPDSAGAGAAYVFRRTGTSWAQDTQLTAATGGAEDAFGAAVSISADGTLVAVGAYGEDSSTNTVNSTPNEAAPFAGAAYIFRRASGGWTQEAYLKAANAGANDYFGGWLSLSGDGSTVAIGAEGEASSIGGVNQTPNEGASRAGAVYVFRGAAGAWSQEAYLKASSISSEDWFGAAISLSADGSVVAIGAYGEDSSSASVGQPNEGMTDAGAVYLFRRSGSTWNFEAYLKAGNRSSEDFFGWSVSVAADGGSLVVGAPGARSVYFFKRASGAWSERVALPSPDADGDEFGTSLALSANPTALLVGAPSENSSSTGVGSTPNDLASLAGAAYVFQ